MNTELEERLRELGIDLADIDQDDIVTGAQAARLAGVTPQAIHNWRKRGHLRNIGTKEHPRYLRLDVAKAELATRRPGVIRKRPDIASWQMGEHWDRINPEAAA